MTEVEYPSLPDLFVSERERERLIERHGRKCRVTFVMTAQRAHFVTPCRELSAYMCVRTLRLSVWFIWALSLNLYVQNESESVNDVR